MADLKWYFEDFVPGRTIPVGSRTLGEDEIIAFARQFDPQPFHVDREAAAKSHFGGLIASVGQRMIQATANLLAARFFKSLEAETAANNPASSTGT